jgi:hypothetical protein
MPPTMKDIIVNHKNILDNKILFLFQARIPSEMKITAIPMVQVMKYQELVLK